MKSKTDPTNDQANTVHTNFSVNNGSECDPNFHCIIFAVVKVMNKADSISHS